jgi:protein TonB
MVSLAASVHGVEEGRPIAVPMRRIAYWAMGAALLLHIAIVIICIIDWSALFALALARAEPPDAIPVALVYVPPPPPPKPVVQPQPEPQPPSQLQPLESGKQDKTEAKADDVRQPALPQPKSPPPPAPEPKKAAVPPTGAKEPVAAKTETRPAERQTAALPEPRKQPSLEDLVHTARLPSEHGGTGKRDASGDPYLNNMQDIVIRHRIYPPASEFPSGAERLVVYRLLIDPSGELVQITLLAPSGSDLVDEAAGLMVRRSAPFPPLPASWLHIRTPIIMEMPMFPSPH